MRCDECFYYRGTDRKDAGDGQALGDCMFNPPTPFPVQVPPTIMNQQGGLSVISLRGQVKVSEWCGNYRSGMDVKVLS